MTRRVLIVAAWGLAGLAVALGLTVGAFALAGQEIGEPVTPRGLIGLASPDQDRSGSPTATASATDDSSDRPSPTASASSDDHGGGDDNSGPGSEDDGSDDNSGSGSSNSGSGSDHDDD